jgi:hypothetical protein
MGRRSASPAAHAREIGHANEQIWKMKVGCLQANANLRRGNSSAEFERIAVQPPFRPIRPYRALAPAFFLAAHLAFIRADIFFRMAGLMRRPMDFFAEDAAFFGADFRFCCAQRCFIAAEIRFRAAGLIRRRFRPAACLAWLTLGGRPRRAGREPSPASAAIAFSIRLASCLS